MSFFQFKLFSSKFPVFHACFPKEFGGVSLKDGEWLIDNKIIGVIEEQFKDFDKKITYAEQVHGCNVFSINDKNNYSCENGFKNVDGIVTNRKGVLLAVKHADCIPIFLCDPKKSVIGLVHCGWKGTVGKIGLAAFSKMISEYGCQAQDILIGIGPGAHSCCYQIGKDDNKALLKQLPEWNNYLIENDSEWKIDLAGFIKKMFIEAGVKPQHIEVSQICTICNTDYFSWARDRDIKRGLSIIGLNY